MAATTRRHHPAPTAAWNLLSPRYRPDESLAGHLIFALKWEGVDLAILAQLFKAAPADAIRDVVLATPTGAFARRLWYIYEWMTGTLLDVPDLGKVRLVTVVDAKQQFALERGQGSSRHKVLDNLPGTSAFCPMVRRVPALVASADKHFDERARAQIGRMRPDLVARAAAFLLLNDSKSSFAIEGERPSGDRAVRWG